MSLFKYGDLEVEADFMDADFMEDLEKAQDALQKDYKNVPKTGRTADIIRAQISVFDNFFDALFGEGAGYAVRSGKNSLAECFGASEALLKVNKQDLAVTSQMFTKYQVQNVRDNGEQRRFQQKQHSKSYYNNQGQRR